MKKTKKILSVFLALLMMVSIIPMSSITASAAYENTYSNTGNQRADIIGVAKTQIGYVESGNNDTKYGDWYGLPGEAWCAMFVSWCANQAGIPTSVLKKTAAAKPTSFGIPQYDGASYTPQSGDLFFEKDYSHVGLVYYTDGEYFYTIEGNWSNKVCSNKKKISEHYFGVPNYTNTVKPTLSLSTNTVYLQLGGTESSSIKVNILNSNGNCDMKIERNNDNCWNSLVMGTSGGSLNISAKKIGTTVFTVKLIDLSTDQVIDSKNITANISAKTYTVSYNANGGSGAPSSQTKTHGTTLTLSSTKPTRTGYTFLGWSTSSTATSATYSAGGSFTTNANTTLYAVWKENTLIGITLEPNNGSDTGDKIYWGYDSITRTLDYVPTRTGYTLLGWSKSSTATSPTYYNGQTYTFTSSTTLYAVWKANTYSVKYNANGGSGSMSNSSHTYDVAKSLSSNAFTRSGYTFLGWSTSSSATTPIYTNGQSVKNLTSTNGGTVNLYAVWQKNSTTPDVPSNPDVNFTISIQEPSRTTIRYKDGIILHSVIEGELPEGATIEWAVDNNNFEGGYSEDGMDCVIVSKNNGYTIVMVIVCDANDNVIAADAIEMRSKAGFFDKIGGFFRNLFGTTKIYEN